MVEWAGSKVQLATDGLLVGGAPGSGCAEALPAVRAGGAVADGGLPPARAPQ